MHKVARAIAGLALFAAACAAAPREAPSVSADSLAILGADVLPMSGPAKLIDQTVIIAGNRIVEVGPRSQVQVPKGVRRIDARGMTLMPGLVDMHVHLPPEPGERGDAAHRALALMLAHGTTTARAMVGSPNNIAVREAVEQGRIAGPRLYVASPPVNAGNTSGSDEARAKVAAAKAAGYDLIKSHQLPDVTVWQAVQDEARRHRLPTAGHVTNEVGLARAMAAGQQVEHLDSVVRELLRPGSPEASIAFAQFPPAAVTLAASQVSDAELAALAKRASLAKSWHVPTLSVFARFVDPAPGTAALLARPEMRYVPQAILAQWTERHPQILSQTNYTAEAANAFRRLRGRIVAAFQRSGVPVMAGSDTAQLFQIPGAGLISEIEELNAAGLTPLEALRSATVVPRSYFRSLPNGGSAMGRAADFGTVQKGGRADLILLRADPSRNVSNLRQLDSVIVAGRLYDRRALDKMLEEVASSARTASPPNPTR